MSGAGMPEDWQIADLYGVALIDGIAREIHARVPIEYDPGASPGSSTLSVRVCAFLGGFHVNAFGLGEPFFGPDLLPVGDRGLGEGVPWGARKPGENDWVGDVRPALLAVIQRAEVLVHAHATGNVCTARYGYADQVAEGRYPYQCQMPDGDRHDRHRHGQHWWTATKRSEAGMVVAS